MIQTRNLSKSKNSFWNLSEKSFLTKNVKILIIKVKYVKISGWEFELELSEKKCNRIILNADNVVFIANKNNKK